MDKSIPECKQARPHGELIRELLDSRVPKNEREHAAAREIEALRAEVEMLRDAFSDDDMTAGAHWFGRYVEQKRRAERLAEALETCLEVEERPSIIEMARVALRDQDQEGK